MNSNVDLVGDFDVLIDFRHAGVIILWGMGAEKIMCDTKNI